MRLFLAVKKVKKEQNKDYESDRVCNTDITRGYVNKLSQQEENMSVFLFKKKFKFTIQEEMEMDDLSSWLKCKSFEHWFLSANYLLTHSKAVLQLLQYNVTNSKSE